MSKLNIKIVPLELNDNMLNILLKFDEDNQRINFPKDKPNREETIKMLQKEYQEEPEGMNLIKYNNEIIGVLFLKTSYNPYRCCHYGDLRYIYLIDEFRGKGVGQILMNYMEEYFKKKGCEYMFLGTSSNNEASRALFRKKGFVETRVMMEKEL